MRPIDPRQDGIELAKALAAKIGRHDGSEGHPINFERSGEYHRYMKRYVFHDQRKQFAQGYRDGWMSLLGS